MSDQLKDLEPSTKGVQGGHGIEGLVGLVLCHTHIHSVHLNALQVDVLLVQVAVDEQHLKEKRKRGKEGRKRGKEGQRGKKEGEG